MEEWDNLEFSAEESEVLDLGDSSEARNVIQNTVIGKVWTVDTYNVRAFKNTLLGIWKTRGAVEITDLAENLFSFKFMTTRDRDQILNGQPWNFNGHVIALQAITGEEQPSELNPHLCPIWVRIYNLPLNLRDEQSVLRIGKQPGEIS